MHTTSSHGHSRISSRARLLAALAHRQSDHVPCCFSAFSILRERCASREEFVDRQIELGLDASVWIGDPPVEHGPGVKVRERRADSPGSPPLLSKEYVTPAGTLATSVAMSEDWPWGDHVPFMDDFLIPRSTKFLVTEEADLEALRCLLSPLSDAAVAAYRDEARAARELAESRGLLLVGGTGMAGDLACWLTGIEGAMYAALDRPGFLRSLLAVIEEWNRARMELVLAEGPDLLIRRGWYENADFWSPPVYRELLLPGLRRDAEQAHAAGARLGYIMSTSSMPLLDMLIEAGVDVLLGVDPAQDRAMDLRLLKEKTAGRMALWGGVCGYLTVERGNPAEVRRQVREAIVELAPGGGFILAPVTNVRAGTERAWENVRALIDEWQVAREHGEPGEGC